MLDYGECAEAVVFEPASGAALAGIEGHGENENSKNPHKTRRAVLRVPGAGQKIRPSLSRVKAG